MRCYAVLSNNPTDDNIVLSREGYPWVLASFEATQDPRGSLTYTPKLLLDSGAFTVWTQGKTVDRAELVTWAKEIVDHYDPVEVRLINLDVIPGTLTRRPGARERIEAAKESAYNAGLIRADGVPVVEVFHRYEPFEFLEQILDRRQAGEIIAIGGLVGRADPKGKVVFCETCWKVIHDHSGGWDRIPGVHGLGISGDAPLARRFPWFSVDSSTWFTMRNFNIHVNRSGGFKPRNRETAPRTTKDISKLNAGRRLRRWERQARQLTAMWDRRGVRFVDVEDVL